MGSSLTLGRRGRGSLTTIYQLHWVPWWTNCSSVREVIETNKSHKASGKGLTSPLFADNAIFLFLQNMTMTEIIIIKRYNESQKWHRSNRQDCKRAWIILLWPATDGAGEKMVNTSPQGCFLFCLVVLLDVLFLNNPDTAVRMKGKIENCYSEVAWSKVTVSDWRHRTTGYTETTITVIRLESICSGWDSVLKRPQKMTLDKSVHKRTRL